MNEHDILQAIIALTYLVAIVLLATNRYVVGCFVMIAGVPAWWMAAGDQWGFKVVAGTIAIVYILGIIGRWPRKLKQKLLPAPDEHEQGGIG